MEKIADLYTKMPGWVGYIDDIPFWFGTENDENYIWASVESGGLLFEGKMKEDEWDNWFRVFMKKASLLLGFKVYDVGFKHYHKCQCCGFKTISERGQYYICKVCFWEDDGGDDPDIRSCCNHSLTLREGRKNFKEYGACEERFIKHVVENPEKIYEK